MTYLKCRPWCLPPPPRHPGDLPLFGTVLCHSQHSTATLPRFAKKSRPCPSPPHTLQVIGHHLLVVHFISILCHLLLYFSYWHGAVLHPMFIALILCFRRCANYCIDFDIVSSGYLHWFICYAILLVSLFLLFL